MNTERRRGPSTATLSFGGIIAIASLLAAGVATYNSVKVEIKLLKQEVAHQRELMGADQEEKYSCELVRKDVPHP